MDWHAYARNRLSEITGDPARDEEIVEEIAQNLADRYAAARAAGASHDRALDQIARQLDAKLTALLREADRPRPLPPRPPASMRTTMLNDLWLDVRYAMRLLVRTPAFTAAAVTTLALGVGVTITIFNVIDAVLLRPVPFPGSERFVLLWETDRASGTERRSSTRWP